MTNRKALPKSLIKLCIVCTNELKLLVLFVSCFLWATVEEDSEGNWIPLKKKTLSAAP